MTAVATSHHVPEEQLLAYVAGTGTEAAALALACHLSLCARCAALARDLEALGGAALDPSRAQPLARGSLDRVLARLDEVEREVPSPPAVRGEELLARWGIPSAVARYLPSGADATRWRRLVPGITRIDLRVGPTSTVARLVTLTPGIEIPLHDHEGTEYTVIFAGALHDDQGRFARGDISIREAGAAHVQRVEKHEPCVALVVNEGPLRPLTWKGKALSFLSRL